MSFQSTPIIEIAAVVIGLAGPLLTLVRELLNSEWLGFIWKRRTVAVALVREALLLGIVALVFWGQFVVLDRVLDQTTLAPVFSNVLRTATTISSITIGVVFLIRIVFLGAKHFRQVQSAEKSSSAASET